jgi:hypothetical protein
MAKRLSSQQLKHCDGDKGASDDSSDVDIYLEEPEEMVDIPLPSQRITSPSMRSKAPKRTTNASLLPASKRQERRSRGSRDSKYDLTPLGEQNTNRRKLVQRNLRTHRSYSHSCERDCTS